MASLTLVGVLLDVVTEGFLDVGGVSNEFNELFLGIERILYTYIFFCGILLWRISRIPLVNFTYFLDFLCLFPPGKGRRGYGEIIQGFQTQLQIFCLLKCAKIVITKTN